MSTITNSRNLFVWVVVTGALLVGGDVGAQVVSADLMPTGRVVYPGLSNQGFKLVPPTFNIGALGFDPDSPDGRPARYRFLFKPAINSEGGSIRTPFEYSLHYEEVLSLDDPEWSDWQDVPVVQDDIRVQFVDLPSGEYFFFSVQFMDQDGAVGITARQVKHHTSYRDYHARCDLEEFQTNRLHLSAGQFCSTKSQSTNGIHEYIRCRR